MPLTDAEIKQSGDLTLKANPYLPYPNKAFGYQKRQILLALKRRRHVIGDDVGLGKTFESLAHFTYIKTAYPDMKALVFAEKIALKQWEQEIAKFTTGLTSKIITAQTHDDPKLRISALRNFDRDILITTYSLAYTYKQYLLEAMQPRFVLYADEPNYFKNPETQLHKKMIEISAAADRAYGMTATIIENRLEEAWSIFRVICLGGPFDSRVDFEREFCITKPMGRNRKIVVGYKNLDVFKARIEPFYYGRVQDDPEVEQELPEVLAHDLPIELPYEQSMKVVEAMNRLVETATGEIKQIQLLPSLILASQMVNDPALAGFDMESAKTDAMIEALKNSLAGERVLVHSKFRTQIDRLEIAFKKHGIDCLRITGKETDDQRNEAKRRFMSDDPEDRVNVLLMTRAGLKSANLQKGGHMFFYDLPWSYGLYRQGVGRIRRTGSTHKKIGVYRLLGVLHPRAAAMVGTDETIDHAILRTLERKKLLFNFLTDDTTTIEASDGDFVDIMNEVKKSRKKIELGG